MRKSQWSPQGRYVVVCGAGVTGQAMARRLKALGARVEVTDDRERERIASFCTALEAEGIPVFPGGHDPARLQAADLIAVSPGVHTEREPFPTLQREGKSIWSEVELAYRLTQARLVGVTGTKGKSTTAALLAAMLQAPLANAEAYQPVGLPLISLVGPGEPPLVVVEVSSYQLQHVEAFRPEVAILLNIAQDHADRHPSLEEYAEIKGRIFARQGPEDVAVYWAEDPRVVEQARRGAGRKMGFCLQRPLERGGWQEGGRLWFRAEPGEEPVSVLAWEEVSLPLRRQPLSTLAATTAALAAGASWERVREMLRTFPGLPHRLEEVASWRGIRFINDSKATNPQATLWALKAFSENPVILIAGGDTKDNDLTPLREPFRRLKGLVLLGRGKGALRRLAEEAGTNRIAEAEDLEEAVERAMEWAREGDVVLLSPACSSLDMFSHFAERGEAFRRAVLARVGSAEP